MLALPNNSPLPPEAQATVIPQGVVQTVLAPDQIGYETFPEDSSNLDGFIWPLHPPALNDSSVTQRQRSVLPASQDSSVTTTTLSLWSQRYVSASCRQFIISVTRAFPRMMMRPQTLPPFVHPVGCGLEFSGDQETWQADPPTFAPLKPLAACVNIAHAFVTRVPNSDQFLWHTIDAEHQRIRNEVGRCAHLISRNPQPPHL